jgi:hypothetical protein
VRTLDVGPRRAGPAAAEREQAVDYLVRQRLVRREAERFGLAVDREQIDRAIGFIMEDNGIDERGLAEELQRRGVTMEEYREAIGRSILDAEVSILVVGSFRPQDPGEESRPYFDRLRARLEAVPLEYVAGECVESWPEVRPEAVRFEGASATGADELRRAVAGAADDAGWLALDGRGLLDPEALSAVLGVYQDLGYVEARVDDVGTEPGRPVLRITEGPRRAWGALSIAARGAEDAPTALPIPEAEAMRRAPAPGDWFSRSALDAWIEDLRGLLVAAGCASPAITAAPEIGEAGVDVRIVVRGCAGAGAPAADW